jgi:hypothetical protein
MKDRAIWWFVGVLVVYVLASGPAIMLERGPYSRVVDAAFSPLADIEDFGPASCILRTYWQPWMHSANLEGCPFSPAQPLSAGRSGSLASGINIVEMALIACVVLYTLAWFAAAGFILCTAVRAQFVPADAGRAARVRLAAADAVTMIRKLNPIWWIGLGLVFVLFALAGAQELMFSS